MKNLLRTVFISLVWVYFLPIHSQNYIPILGESNRWSVTNCFGGCMTDTYYCSSDTTISNLDYKILDGYHYISGNFLIREDSSNQSVYIGIISGTKLNEYLVYDFNLSIGDSIKVYNPISPIPEDIGFVTLDSVKSEVLLDGLTHRFLYLSNYDKSYLPVWAEGIGSLSLINSPCATPNINGLGHLSCYSKDDELVYSNLDSIQNCDFHIELSVNKNNSDKTIVYPNPVDDQLNILGVKNIEAIYIFNLNGEMVYEKPGQNEKILTLDVSALDAGVYIVQISALNQSNLYRRIIIP